MTSIQSGLLAQHSQVRRHIVIVGGGTAGWMAANLMAIKWAKYPYIKISLIESADIGIIGVGEGSTPQLKAFFDSIGIADKEWMSACNASYKVGINFENWSTNTNEDRYFHPFFSDVDRYVKPEFDNSVNSKRSGIAGHLTPNTFFLGAYLSEQAKSPIPSDDFPFDVHYGYHFDSHLLGKFLKELAIKRGVNHIVATVNKVNLNARGNISSLTLSNGKTRKGDFFVDSSGFKGLLLQQALKVPFDSFKSNLFNDRAIVVATPTMKTLKPETRSIAMKNGWRWQIPLPGRTGNGYVYSSAHCSKTDAEKELVAALNLKPDEQALRQIEFKSGQVRQHWSHNCVAIGLSQSFIEPLEATSLDIVQDTILNFMAAYQTGGFSNQNRHTFNARTSLRIEGVRDYIVAHYVMSKRRDTQYWRDNTSHQNWSPLLSNLYDRWMQNLDISELLNKHEIGTYFPEVSWQCLFSGYQVFANTQKNISNISASKTFEHSNTAVRDFMHKCSRYYKPHHAVLLGA